MHPEILRQMINQSNRETQTRAEENRKARIFLRALRSSRRNGSVAGRSDYDVPVIPDYVDGTFVNGTAGQTASARGRVPAARNAA